MTRTGRPFWSAVTLGVAALIVLPIALVVFGTVSPSTEAWGQLWRGPLPGMLWTTGVLLLLVGVGTLLLGVSLAWLTTAYEFPGRRIFTWALMLPLAMPAYVLGFVFVATFDVGGPVQEGLRAVFGQDLWWFPSVRSVGGAALVMSLSLYPYAFILARAAFREQAPATFETARLLGDSRRAALFRVVLPLARPSIAAGLALGMMETLTDFATVQYFNVRTLSVGVYQVWRGMFDRETAVELAALVLLIALAVIAVERLLRGRARFHQRGTAREFERVILTGWRRVAAVGACTSVLLVAIVLPVTRLIVWAVASPEALPDVGRAFENLSNSIGLAVVAALVTVGLGLLIAAGSRFSGRPLVARLSRLVTVGYAVPGPVVAVGVLVLVGSVSGLAGANPAGIVFISITGLVYAYVIRFMALGYGAIDASLDKVSPAVVDAAHTLGSSPGSVMRRVYFPLARSGAAAGAVLVAIDVLKELPIVLFIRPFGFTTVPIWVWEHASESRWAAAAVPALLIIVSAMIPIGIYLWREQRRGALPAGLLIEARAQSAEQPSAPSSGSGRAR